MTHPTHAESFNRLVAAYPRATFQPGSLQVYIDMTRDIPAPLFAQVVDYLIRTQDWPPTIAQIRRRATEVTLALPSDDEALTQIEDRIRWAKQPEDERGPRTWVHPIVEEAIQHVGGYYSFRVSDSPSVIHGQFLKLFRQGREAAILDAQSSVRELTQGDRPAA